MKLKITREITAGGKVILEEGNEIIAIKYFSRFFYRLPDGEKELLPKDSYIILGKSNE